MVCADCLPLLEEAASLYQADFLAGFTLSDCPAFDEWQFFQAEELRQDLASVLDRLVQGYKLQGDYEAALPYARRWLALDPLHEPVHRELMRLYAQANQQAAALRQYEECVRLLEEEFGLEPEEETITLAEAIKAKRVVDRLLQEKVPHQSVSQARRAKRIRPDLNPPNPPSNPNPDPQQRYTTEDLLAVGGQGEVYRGLDQLTGQPVVIKRLKPEVMTRDKEAVTRFERESEALRQLDHPNIVRLLASFTHNGQHQIVMEYVPGGTLRDRLAAEGALPPAQVLDLSLELADALSRAHHLHIIHRDLKPSNVLLADDGTPRLTDFGLARLEREEIRLTQSGTILGSPAYMSPEALQGEALDARSDIWSFGILLYEMLAGRLPFAGERITQIINNILQKPVPDIRDFQPDVPLPLVHLLQRVLVKEWADRLPSMRQVAAELEAIRDDRVIDPVWEQNGRNAAAFTPQIHPTPSPDGPPHNLPRQATQFVGREAELAEITGLLQHDPACRFLTLVGPGGIGKTRLALQAAAESLNAFTEGVTFIPLASVGVVDNLLPAIADHLNFSFFGDSNLQTQLIDYLREKQHLLVLDNFEHLIEGAGLLSDILAEASQVKILATSRERLRLQAEWTVDVQGLDFPDKEILTPDETYAALTLFGQCARRAQAGFAPTPAENADIARICRLVQGMPLAIELAASWVKMLSCREIAAEIERSLDFLAAELQDVPARQRNIRAVFQHSWKLTPEPEREVFEKLSVFRGGFTREAAQQVTGASLLVLSSLMDKSLLRRDSSGRYEIHELLRQYGADKLSRKVEALAEVQRRHAGYFAGLMHKQEAVYYSGQRQQATKAINQEIDNVRATWQWAIDHKDYDTLDKYAMSLYFFYETRGLYKEGEAAFHAAFTALQDTIYKEMERHSSCRVIVTTLGWFRFRLARYEETRAILQKVLPILRAGDDKIVLWMATELGVSVAYSLGQYEEARQFSEQNLQMLQARDSEWPWATGQSLTNLGRVYTALGDYERARELLAEGIAVLKQVGDSLGTILSLHTLGRTYHALGHLTEAEQAYQECLELGQLNELPLGEALALNDLGNLNYQQGIFAKAKEYYLASLKIYREIGDRRGRALALNNLGLVDTALGQYKEAEQQYQQSLTICEQTRNRRGLALTYNYLSTLARIRQAFARAQELNEESLSHCRDIGYTKGIGLGLQTSGDLALDLGDYPAAERLYQNSLDIYQDIGFQEGGIDCQIGLGRVARLHDEPQAARRYFSQALTDAAALQTIPKVLDTLVHLADLLLLEGQAEKALEIVALAERHSACTRQTQENAAHLLGELMTKLPAEVVAEARSAGSNRDVEDLLKEADLTQST